MGSSSGFQRFWNVENGYGLSGSRYFDTEKYGGTKLGFFFRKNPIYWPGPPNVSLRGVDDVPGVGVGVDSGMGLYVDMLL